MKTKLIRIKDEVKEMSFEEVLEMFTPAIHKEINKQKLAFSRSFEEREDMFQDGCVWLWKAYKSYDVTKKTQFFTHAFMYIRRGVQNETVKNNSAKRAEGYTVSFDAPLTSSDSNYTLKDLLFEEFTHDGVMFANEIIQKAVKTMTKKEVEALKYILEERHSVDLANDTGVSRQCSASRYRIVKKKIEQVALENGF